VAHMCAELLPCSLTSLAAIAIA